MPCTRVSTIVAALLVILTQGIGCQKQARSPASGPTKTAEVTHSVDDSKPAETTPSATTANRRKPHIDAASPAKQQDRDRTGTPVPKKVAEMEKVAEVEKLPTPKLEPRRKPKRPVDSWVIFREAAKPREDAVCEAVWTSGNRLEVHTDNISRITLDLTRLPLGAPKKGPWNLQIDGQGIEITGFRPKKGYTGRIRDLVRSQNGRWTVDRKKLYRERG